MKEIRIGICDDDENMLAYTKSRILLYFDKVQINVEIMSFMSGKLLIDMVDRLDIVFLDIEMPEIDGFSVAEIINAKNSSIKNNNTKISDIRENKVIRDAKIVFLTSHEELARQAFLVNAYRFILKDNMEEELQECLDSFCNSFFREKTYTVMYDNSYITIKENDILFIKSAHNGTEVWTENNVFISDNSLNTWMEVLDTNYFIRVHKSSIANVKKINYIDEYIHMYSGEIVEYSRRNGKALQSMFNQYIYDNSIKR